MNPDAHSHTAWFLWPFVALWDLLTFILKATSRLVGAILGLVFLIAGSLLTVLVITSFIGMPIAFFGFLLMVRSIF